MIESIRIDLVSSRTHISIFQFFELISISAFYVLPLSVYIFQYLQDEVLNISFYRYLYLVTQYIWGCASLPKKTHYICYIKKNTCKRAFESVSRSQKFAKLFKL